MVIWLLSSFFLTPLVNANDHLSNPFYRNPEERREAETGWEMSENIRFSGSFELERALMRDRFSDGHTDEHMPAEVPALELGVEWTMNPWLTAEFLFEADKDPDLRSHMEEGFITLEAERVDISLGRQVLPFGEYYSHFISGPLLEFAETRGNTLLIDVSFAHSMEIHLYHYEGDFADNRYDTDNDWGAGIRLCNSSESLRFGIDYLSDLSESEERLLEEFDDTYERRVAGLDTHLLVGFSNTEFTFEYLHAIERFKEMETKLDKPRAFNAEMAWYFNNQLQLAWRYEFAHELEDEPATRVGMTIAWQAIPQVMVSFDCLRSNYRHALVEQNDEIWLDRRMEYIGQLTLIL